MRTEDSANHPILIKTLLLTITFSSIFFSSNSQTIKRTGDSLLASATLESVIEYAIKNQPLIRQALIDEQITDQQIKSRLADWYPQLNFNYNIQHNFQVQTSVIGGNAVRLGVSNTSYGQFTVRQNLFTPDVLLAQRSRGDVLLQARQTTIGSKIDVAANVAKAFYSVLATMQQIKVAESNIVRLERSLKDAYNQYVAGVADKIDYKRTTITLNNTKATKRSNEEFLVARKEYLKFLIGYPDKSEINIVYDSLAMEKDLMIDTLQMVDYTNRIEYQLLETQRKLLKANLDYNRWAYYPTLAFNGAYNLNYQSDNFAKVYGNNFPNSFAAITLTVPIFQGGKRIANIKQAEYRLLRSDWDVERLKSSVNSEYAQALATYKSNLVNYLALKENIDLATEVYNVIQLQYKSGIKTYLEVITSETELRTSQINYYNALYQLLSSKIDVQRALGQIRY